MAFLSLAGRATTMTHLSPSQRLRWTVRGVNCPPHSSELCCLSGFESKCLTTEHYFYSQVLKNAFFDWAEGAELAWCVFSLYIYILGFLFSFQFDHLPVPTQHPDLLCDMTATNQAGWRLTHSSSTWSHYMLQHILRKKVSDIFHMTSQTPMID